MASSQPQDTWADAHAHQLAIYRSMTPAERVARAISMSEDAMDITRGGVRRRHPDYTAEQVGWATTRLVLGAALFHEAFPLAPALDP